MEQALKRAAKLANMDVAIVKTGHPLYKRGFILCNGITLGRATIYNGELQYIKWYAAGNGQLTKWDYHMYALTAALSGHVLTTNDYEQLLQKAETLRCAEIQHKKARRSQLPPKEKGHRRAIQGRGLRCFVNELFTEKYGII